MSIKTLSQFGLAGALILIMGGSVFADLELKPYGAVQYRFRERMHTLADDDEHAGTTIDHQNLFSWRTGVRAKVDDQLSLQLQIGNDWSAGEDLTWNANHSKNARSPFQNLFVHIASFKWNPGVIYLEGGVIPLSSNGSLDLLESSLNLGKYDEAGFRSWSTEMINSLMGLRIGVPILKDDIKLGVELFQSIIDQRTQALTVGLVSNIDNQALKGNPSSPLFVLTVPVAAGDFKVTPELAIVLNRNYNSNIEAGDHEILAGLGASYKLSDAVSLNASGGFGTVSNENSQASVYGTAGGRSSTDAEVDGFQAYISNGLLACVGATVKAGPGTIQADFKYNSAVNTEDEEGTKLDYTYFDVRYAYKLHDKFSITPRYRNYYRIFPSGVASNWRMENRLEIFLDASF